MVINSDGIFQYAKKASFLKKVQEYNEMLELYIHEQILKDYKYDKSTLTSISDFSPVKIEKIITSISEKDKNKFAIQNGELVYIYTKEDEIEKAWCESIGVACKKMGTLSKLKIYGNSTNNESCGDFKNGKYNIPIRLVEKNLFIPNNIKGQGSITNFNGIQCYKCKDAGMSWLQYDIGNIEENSVFTIKFYRDDGVEKGFNLLYYFEDGTQKLDWLLPDTVYNRKFTKKLTKMQISSNYNLDVYIDLTVTQLENGTEATPFELPTQPINLYLNEPLRSLENNYDYIDFYRQEVVRYIGVNTAGEMYLLEEPVIEKIDLTNFDFYKDYNDIQILTTIEPSKIEY